MKFSLIIPVYNVAPYLRECLDSILAQIFTDWEAICVNDGSTDGSGGILDEYAARDVRFRVVHKENGGVSVARNLAIEKASGDYIGFVDADDAIARDWLLRAKEYIEANDADVVRFEMQRWKGGKLPEPKWDNELTILSDRKSLVEWGWPKYLSVDCGGPWNVFARRSLVQDRGTFPVGMRMKEDRIFLLHLLMKTGKMVLSDYQGYFYRERVDGACGSRRQVADARRYVDEVKNLSAKYRGEIERLGSFPIFRRAITWTLVNDIEELIEQGDIAAWRGNRDIPKRILDFRRLGLFVLGYVPARYIVPIVWALQFKSMFGFVILKRCLEMVRWQGEKY